MGNETPTNDAPVTWQGDDAVMPIGTTVEVLACDPAGRIDNHEVPARTACWIRAKIDGSAYWRYRSCDLADLDMDDATFDRLCAAVGEPELRSIVDKAIAHYDVEPEDVSRASDAVEMIRRALHSHRLAALASAPAGDGVEDKASPRPWRIVRYGDGDSLVIHDARKDFRVCFMATPGSEPGAMERIEADAALICQAVNALARPRAAVGEPRKDSDFAWIVPRHPTDAMVQAGLYHCSADMGSDDLFTAFHYMVDEAQQDDAIVGGAAEPTLTDMAAFGASDAACTLYPGADQQAERAAFCEGAAHAASRPRAAVGEQSREAIEKLIRNYEHRNSMSVCAGNGPSDEAYEDFIAAILALQSPPAKVEG